MNSSSRCSAAVCVGLIVGAAVGVAPAPASGRAVGGLAGPAVRLTAGEERDIEIDFVRHAQTVPSGAVISNATQGLPGLPLGEIGRQQAIDLGPRLFDEFGGHPHGVAGIFGGQEQRMIDTIAPFASLEHMTMQTVGTTPQDLGGFNEIGGGIYSDGLTGSLGEYLDALPPLSWVLGNYFAWLPGGNDYNGAQFEDNFGGAVNAVYNQTANVADPVISTNGHITDVVVSGAGAISTWVAGNVNNPDLALVIPIAIGALSSGNLVDNTGQVIVEGNPTDGWTLVSWDGEAFPKDPGLLTELFVDQRDLVTAPQLALWHIFQAAVNGNATTLDTALQTNLHSVAAAMMQYPTSVIDDITGTVHSFSAALAGGESFGDAFDTLILGLPA